MLCTFLLSASAQDEDYRSLLRRGAYREALDALSKSIEPFEPNVPFHWVRERAEIRFLVGEVDQAIRDFEEITGYLRNASDTLRLAELYRYRGRMEDYQTALDDATRRFQTGWGTSSQQESLLTAGRIAELRGEDPKRILSTTYKLLIENWPSYVPVYVAAGDLARSKGSYAIAAKYYEDALARDEGAQDAMAGLAACYWESRDERLDAVLASLSEINPNHLNANALRVEMFLDSGNTEAATERIDAMLAINPVHTRFRALKAATHFLDDDLEGMQAVQTDALAFNPHASEVYRVPGRIASRHYRFKEGAELQRKALEVDETDHAARALLGFDLLRLGDDNAGREQLERAFASDPYNVQVYNSLEVLDTLRTFATVSRGDFVLNLPQEQSPVLGDMALDLLEDAGAMLEEKYAIALETPVRVQIFDSHDDFIVRSVGLPGSTGHLGICFGRLITMDSPTARPKGTMDWHSVLFHEFVHVVTLQKTKNRMPRWLSEGVSVYEETRRNPAWGMLLDPEHRELIDPEHLPGTSDLELYFTQPPSPAHLMLGYFLAGEFVVHYADAYGEAALVDALDRIGRKERTLEALASAAGATQEELDGGFRDFLEKRFAALDNLEAFGEAMKAGVVAFSAKDWPTAEQEFLRARELFPEYSAEDGPLAALNRVYEATGDKEAQKKIVGTMLSLDSANLGGWRRLALLHRETGDWEGVAKAAVAAAAVDPFDLDMAKLLYEAAGETNDPHLALDAASRLVHIDPVDAASHRLAKVEALVALDRREEAKREVILLLEDKPSFWKAQEVLLDIVEHEKT